VKDVIRRDLRLSYLVAPFRIVVPILGYVVLYPVILNGFDAAILGLWSLLAVIPQALSSIDFGFSLILTREVGGTQGKDLRAAADKYRAAQGAFLIAAPLLLAAAVIASVFLPLQDLNYSTAGIQFSIIVMTATVILQRLAALDLAILNGLGDNYYTHFVAVWSPMVFFAIAVAGALLRVPLEALSIGFFSSVVIGWAAYRWRLRSKHTAWFEGDMTPMHKVKVCGIVQLMRDGWLLYAASLGMMLRDPLLRYTIGLSIGLEAVAVYEVAMRLGRTGRDVISSGFSALYSSFSVLIRQNEFDEVRTITSDALLLLCLGGGGLIGGIYLFAPTLLQFWLGDIGVTMVEPTRIVCMWAAITLLNTPFWYQLLAGKSERHAAQAIWLHTLSVLLIIPVAMWIEISLTEVLLYWLVGSILTQVYLFYYAEKLYGLVVSSFRSAATAIVILVQLLAVVVLAALSAAGSISPFIATVIFGCIVIGLLFMNKSRIFGWYHGSHA
jgi:O-antigen/teichoic acid export membrane protein